MSGPAQHVIDAGESIRSFNHVSRSPGECWEYPSDSYGAIGGLAYLVRLLLQALEQSVRPASLAFDAGRVLVDGGGDVKLAEARVRAAVYEATQCVPPLLAAVEELHRAVAPLGYVVDDEDGAL